MNIGGYNNLRKRTWDQQRKVAGQKIVDSMATEIDKIKLEHVLKMYNATKERRKRDKHHD